MTFGSADSRASPDPQQPGQAADREPLEASMIVLGIIALIAGFVLKIAVLWSIGILLVVVGVVLAVLGSIGRAVGGRRHYY